MLTEGEQLQIRRVFRHPWYRDYNRRAYSQRSNEDQTILSGVMLEFLGIIGPIIQDRINHDANMIKVDTFVKMINLLAACEGIISNIMDIFIMFLIEIEHADIYSERSGEFLTEYTSVKQIATSVKIKFLEIHEFDFFERLFPRRLRNAFSHMNFRIEDDGSITTYNQRGNPITPRIENAELLDYFHEVTNFMNFLTEEIAKVL